MTTNNSPHILSFTTFFNDLKPVRNKHALTKKTSSEYEDKNVTKNVISLIRVYYCSLPVPSRETLRQMLQDF